MEKSNKAVSPKGPVSWRVSAGTGGRRGHGAAAGRWPRAGKDGLQSQVQGRTAAVPPELTVSDE